MAKKDKKEDSEDENDGLKSNTKHGIWAIVFFVLALFFLMSAFSVTGVAGEFIKNILKNILGNIGYFFLPVLLVLLGISYLKSKTPNIGWRIAGSGAMFLLSSLGILNILGNKNSGGLLGETLAVPLVSLFEVYASIIFLSAILIISVLVIFDTELSTIMPTFTKIWNIIRKVLGFREKVVEEENPEEEDETQEEIPRELDEQEELTKSKKFKKQDEENFEPKLKTRTYNLSTNYVPPPMSLLEEDQGKPNTGDIKANANVIRGTLLNFGIA